MDPTTIVGYTTDSNVVGYSQNNFIWSSIEPKFDFTTCNLYQDKNCSSITTDNSGQCLLQAFCKNKENQDKIMALQSVHNGADVRYLDTKNFYNMQLLTTVNLGVGILGIGLFIFYNH